MSNESNNDKNMPDVVPAVDEVVSLNETDDDDAIDLMDGVGLKKPEHIEPDVVFKGEEKPKVNETKVNKKVKVVVEETESPNGEEAEETPNLAVMPDEVKEDLMEQGIKPMEQSDIKKVKYNKNGKPRKPMTKDRLEKLAIARQKALETRQRNKKLKEEAQKKLKIKQIVDDDNVEVQITKKIIGSEAPQRDDEESVPPTPTPQRKQSTPSVKKLSREEKDKKIQDAVAEGVKKALEVERLERKKRKEEKKRKAEEEKEKSEKLNKDKMISNQINKLNDIDNFYDKCFNFT